MHILVIEDDERIARNIKIFLQSEGFNVTASNTFEEGLYLATEESYDVILVDWMLPDGDGITICKTLRNKKNATPILMLTAKSQLEDKITGLDTGADDYMTKPFAKEELLSRIKALLRRSSKSAGSPIIKINRLSINTNTTKVMYGNEVLNLAPREYSLLEFLARHKCEVVDRMTLLHHVWGEDIDMFSNTVDVHIRYIRKKLEKFQSKPLIQTVKNKGYMLCED